jgi:hypothetical protein
MRPVSWLSGPSVEESGEASGGRVNHSWVSFAFADESAGEIDAGRPGERYRLEAMNVVRGPQATGLRCGQAVSRIETTGARPPASSPGVLVGSAEPVASSTPETRAELARRWSDSRWRVALLIPMALSPSWWGLAREERPPAHLCWTQGSADSPIVARAMRTLYRARTLRGAEWDFLAYLEMQPQDVAPIRQALAELRDHRKNPCFTHVERTLELWMTRDLARALPSDRRI